MSLKLAALDKCLAALCTHVNPGTVRVQVLPHCRVVPGKYTLSLTSTFVIWVRNRIKMRISRKKLLHTTQIIYKKRNVV
jgi:hypothetical protein